MRFHALVDTPHTSNMSASGLVHYVHWPLGAQPAPLLAGMDVSGKLTLASNSLDVFPAFDHVHFDQPVKLIAIRATVPLDFVDCVFDEPVTISHSRFTDGVRFSNCEFKGGLELIDDEFGTVNLDRCTQSAPPADPVSDLKCDGCSFESLRISTRQPDPKKTFKDVSFDECSARSCDFTGLCCSSLNVINSKFSASDFSGVDCATVSLKGDEFENATFNTLDTLKACFTDVRLDSDLELQSSTLQSLTMTRTSVKGDTTIRAHCVDLHNVRFDGTVTFDLADAAASVGKFPQLVNLVDVNFCDSTRINRAAIESLKVRGTDTWKSLKSSLFHGGNYGELLAVQCKWQQSTTPAAVPMAPGIQPPGAPANAIRPAALTMWSERARDVASLLLRFVEHIFCHFQLYVALAIAVLGILMLASLFIRLIQPTDVVFVFRQFREVLSAIPEFIHWIVYQVTTIALRTVNASFWAAVMALLILGLLTLAVLTIPPSSLLFD